MACVFIWNSDCLRRWHLLRLAAKESIIVAVTRKFVLLLPLIYILPHVLTGNRTYPVYMATGSRIFLAMTFTALMFRKQFKKALSSLMKRTEYGFCFYEKWRIPSKTWWNMPLL